jgi:FSR family fosmidomycin resistance protein-like MFS transporter
MSTSRRRWLIVGLGILHFLADGMSAFVVFWHLYPQTGFEDTVLVFLAYNGLAFLLQPLFGILVDRVLPARVAVLAGIVCIALGFVQVIPIVATVVLIGIGNGLFHVGGGKLTSLSYPGKKAELGFFVAFGAVGLSLGTLIASEPMGYLFLALSMIILPFVFVWSQPIRPLTVQTDAQHPAKGRVGGVGILLLIAVFLRGALGKAIPSNLSNAAEILIAISFCAAMGKWLGGVFADLTSNRFVILLSLPLSGIAFIGGGSGLPFLYPIGVFLFNMSMPITLDLMIRIMPSREGFAFGLLAAMLFPGYLIGMESIHGNWNGLLAIAGILISFAFVLLANGYVERNEPCRS